MGSQKKEDLMWWPQDLQHGKCPPPARPQRYNVLVFQHDTYSALFQVMSRRRVNTRNKTIEKEQGKAKTKHIERGLGRCIAARQESLVATTWSNNDRFPVGVKWMDSLVCFYRMMQILALFAADAGRVFFHATRRPLLFSSWNNSNGLSPMQSDHSFITRTGECVTVGGFRVIY